MAEQNQTVDAIYVSVEAHRNGRHCQCGREHASREARWVPFDAKTHTQICRYCWRSHPLHDEGKKLVDRLTKLDVARKFVPAIAIAIGVSDFGRQVCNRQTEVDIWCPQPIYAGRFSIVIPPLPSGGAGTRWTYCARCLDANYGSVAALVRELNGESPLEPLPPPAQPEPTAAELSAQIRQRQHLAVMEAIYGADENRVKLELPDRANRILAVIDSIVAAKFAEALATREERVSA
jgi:hypothetical protein